jgi:hypothetical protein
MPTARNASTSPSARRHHEADLTEHGRDASAPRDEPDAFVLPDLPTP